MAIENLVDGLLVIAKLEKLCDTCQFGKQIRKPFPKEKKLRAKQKLELVHPNISGPMKTLSLNCSKYYIVLIAGFIFLNKNQKL